MALNCNWKSFCQNSVGLGVLLLCIKAFSLCVKPNIDVPFSSVFPSGKFGLEKGGCNKEIEGWCTATTPTGASEIRNDGEDGEMRQPQVDIALLVITQHQGNRAL